MDRHECITEDEFDQRFGFVEAPDSGGSMFWDLDHDRAELERFHAERRLWTWCDGEGDRDVLCAGFRFVNRYGYAVSQRPYPEGVYIEMTLDVFDAYPLEDRPDDEAIDWDTGTEADP